ncbi:MAG: hypothetical protein ACOC1X_01220 [Promethearchaeota archaeon]
MIKRDQLGYTDKINWSILLEKYREGKVYLEKPLEVHYQNNNILILKDYSVGDKGEIVYKGFIAPKDISFEGLESRSFYYNQPQGTFVVHTLSDWERKHIVSLYYQVSTDICLLSRGIKFTKDKLGNQTLEKFVKNKLLKGLI